MSKNLHPNHLISSPKRTLKPYKKKRGKKQSEQEKSLIVMNQNGEFFSGFYKGYFKWSPDQCDAKQLSNTAQVATIQRHEPSMELIYEFV